MVSRDGLREAGRSTLEGSGGQCYCGTSHDFRCERLLLIATDCYPVLHLGVSLRSLLAVPLAPTPTRKRKKRILLRACTYGMATLRLESQVHSLMPKSFPSASFTKWLWNVWLHIRTLKIITSDVSTMGCCSCRDVCVQQLVVMNPEIIIQDPVGFLSPTAK